MTVRCICIIFLVILLYGECNGSEPMVQEAAKVLYWNPKYVTDINIFTYRSGRHSPYVTSVNSTTLHAWDNNITISVDCYSLRTQQELFSLQFKLCDVIHISWAKEWYKQYSNVPTQCPLLPGKFIFKEMVLPPKNFPIPLPSGDYSVGLIFVTTKTKEKILELKINLKVKGNTSGKQI